MLRFKSLGRVAVLGKTVNMFIDVFGLKLVCGFFCKCDKIVVAFLLDRRKLDWKVAIVTWVFAAESDSGDGLEFVF